MARIILMRHGRPSLDLDGAYGQWLSAKVLAPLIDEYETADLMVPQAAPTPTQELASTAHYAIVSPAPRALSSFLSLRLPVEFLTDADFREAPLVRPFLPRFLKSLPFPLLVWAILLRLIWWAGLANGKEGYRASRARAQIAAAKLEQAAHEHEIILLAGHGIFNHFLAKRLKAQGWAEQRELDNTPARSGYWSCMIFDKSLSTGSAD